ncbi:MAG: hypothetical protein WC205_09480 [Opitutaceae bacterium]
MELLHALPTITGVREMWLMVMGGVLIAVGGAFFARLAWAWFVPRLVTPMLVVLPSREATDEHALPDGRRSAV